MSQKEERILVLGNPLLDVIVYDCEKYIVDFKLDKNSAVMLENDPDRYLKLFEEILKKSDNIYVPGGSAQNTAKGVLFYCGKQSVVYFGSVGDDKQCELLIESNKNYFLETVYQKYKEEKTGVCIVLVNGNNRSMITDLGASKFFNHRFLLIPDNWKYVENSDFFYIEGFHVSSSMQAIMLLAEHCFNHNKLLVFNLSSTFVPKQYKNDLDLLIPYIDIMISNGEEAECFSETYFDIETATDITKYTRSFLVMPKKNILKKRVWIITQGKNPTIFSQLTDENEFKYQETEVIPIDEKEILDTNGAGDAFVSGFFCGLIKKKTMEELIQIGMLLANESLKHVGFSLSKNQTIAKMLN